MTEVISAAFPLAWAALLTFGVFCGWPVIYLELRRERRARKATP